MSKTIKYKNNPVTLVGRNIKPGMRAPEFLCLTGDLSLVQLSDFNGKIKVLTSFLSLDTRICELQVREFERRAAGMSDDVVILAVSFDLPYAQKRFCRTNNIANIKVLSDYRYRSFGINYGLLIKELNLLARALVILDKNNNVRYINIPYETTHEPDYDVWLGGLDEIITQPSIPVEKALPYKCVPCEAEAPPLDKSLVDVYMREIKEWILIDNCISKNLKFKDFVSAKYFFDIIAVIAEEQGHHPDLKFLYNKIEVKLTTHAVGGLSENDFVMAKIIDELQE